MGNEGVAEAKKGKDLTAKAWAMIQTVAMILQDLPAGFVFWGGYSCSALDVTGKHVS